MNVAVRLYDSRFGVSELLALEPRHSNAPPRRELPFTVGVCFTRNMSSAGSTIAIQPSLHALSVPPTHSMRLCDDGCDHVVAVVGTTKPPL
ncbi:MAG: hypothetical protein QM747_13585 [Nocardioides sp.]